MFEQNLPMLQLVAIEMSLKMEMEWEWVAFCLADLTTLIFGTQPQNRLRIDCRESKAETYQKNPPSKRGWLSVLGLDGMGSRMD